LSERKKREEGLRLEVEKGIQAASVEYYLGKDVQSAAGQPILAYEPAGSYRCSAAT
jgi:hypothetical protein